MAFAARVGMAAPLQWRPRIVQATAHYGLVLLRVAARRDWPRDALQYSVHCSLGTRVALVLPHSRGSSSTPANDSASGGCDMSRSTRAQKFTWNADATLSFGTPVRLATQLAAPSRVTSRYRQTCC